MIFDESPAWDCPDCGRRFGDSQMSAGKVTPRTADEWRELVKTMLPKPVQVGETGELQGGSPAAVVVRIEPNEMGEE